MGVAIRRDVDGFTWARLLQYQLPAVEEPEQVAPEEPSESECCFASGWCCCRFCSPITAAPAARPELSVPVVADRRSFGDAKLRADMSAFEARHCGRGGRRTPAAAAFLVPSGDAAQGPPVIVEVAAQPWELHSSPLAHQHTLALRVAARCKVEGLVVDQLFLSRAPPAEAARLLAPHFSQARPAAGAPAPPRVVFWWSPLCGDDGVRELSARGVSLAHVADFCRGSGDVAAPSCSTWLQLGAEVPSFRCDELAQHLYAVLGGGEELRPEPFPEAVIKVLRSLGRRDCLRIAGGLTERSHQARCFQAFKLHPNFKVRPGQAQRPPVDMRLTCVWTSSTSWPTG